MFITTLFVLALSLVEKDTTYSKVQCSNLFTNRVSHHYIPICAYILYRFPTLPPHSCVRSITMFCARHLGVGCWARIKQQNSEHASVIECGSSLVWCWGRRQLDTEPRRLRVQGPAYIGHLSRPHFRPHPQNSKHNTDRLQCQASAGLPCGWGGDRWKRVLEDTSKTILGVNWKTRFPKVFVIVRPIFLLPPKRNT